jgi:hypothetical protein
MNWKSEWDAMIKEGLLVPTGEMRPNSKGELRPVYVLSDKGKARYADMSAELSMPCIYINPKAPEHLKRTMDEVFPDVPRVSADHVVKLVGGFTDGGPELAEYAAALMDETGELTVYAFDDGTPHKQSKGETQ